MLGPNKFIFFKTVKLFQNGCQFFKILKVRFFFPSTMFDFDVAVVIPIAGWSERFSLPVPKQYFNILGKPLFIFCVEEFYKLPYIKKICLVSDRVEFVENIIEENFKQNEKIIVVAGGYSRHASIKNGLMELSKSDCIYKVVVIHDGVRPIIPEHLLIKVITFAADHGAAGATRPLVSTVVKPTSDQFLETSLDRSAYLLSETPQAFLLQLIMNAYHKCSKEDLEKGTECLQLALKYCGIRAKLIEGPEALWKVTYKKDMYSVVPFLTELHTDVCLLGEEKEIIEALKESLTGRVNRVEWFPTGMDSSLPSSPTYNIIICLHNKEIDQGNQMLSFGSVLDVDRQGLIVHVMQHANSDGLQSASIYELYRSGRSMNKQYEKLKKGVVMIHYLTQGEEKRLTDLIISLIFIDPHTISGQTLFV